MKRLSFYLLFGMIRALSAIPIFWMFYFLHFQEEGNGGMMDVLFNGLLFISFGVVHSVMSRRFAKRRMARLVGESFVRTLQIVLGGITLFALLYYWRPVPGVLWQTEGPWYWMLSFLYSSCIVGMIHTMSRIDYSEFVGIRAHINRLKNGPLEGPKFSAKGLYAYCRHPTYLLMLIALWVGPVMTYGRLEFAFLASAYLFIGTFLEERNLREELGQVYDVYRANVPMWIPRVRPWRYEPNVE
jgi:protein-S-isoprenylcysteine O-methyltransferase Ste14